MADIHPQRKSNRQRVPNKKYINDGLDILKKVLTSESEDDSAVPEGLEEDSNSDKEFPEDQLTLEPDDEDDSIADEVSDGSVILTPVEEFEDAHSYASSEPGEPILFRRPAIVRRKDRREGDRDLHSRGMQETPIRTDSNRSRIDLFAGGGLEDVLHIAKSRDRWANDPTLPRRSKLGQSFSYTEEKWQMEATVGWDWYYDEGGLEEFTKRQDFKYMKPGKAMEYIAGAKSAMHTFLAGPYHFQKVFNVGALESMNPSELPQSRLEDGLIINAGSRVGCLDWAPNQAEIQYLAVTTVADVRSRKWENAFVPFSGPASIQIWAFKDKKPELSLIYCVEWGEAVQLKWCPVPRVARGSKQGTSNIGLLAGVWSDGFARVIDVRTNGSVGLQYLGLHSACFTARLPDAIATCLTWLSATDLAVGHSNGQCALFNIYENETSQASPRGHSISLETSHPHNGANVVTVLPSPWLSIDLHPSYILDIASAYPAHPSLLISTSVSGNLRLTSLLAPTTDFVLSNRTRSPPSSIAYHDGLLSILGMEESSETIRLFGLRCFYTSVGVSKLTGPPGPGNGVIDVGKCHATVAAGGADGSVIVTNPMRRILGRRENGHQQCIFKHEWVRQPEPAGEEGEGERRGISRFTEGYKIEGIYVGPKNKPGPSRETVTTTTIFEEETAVTALAWNPNVCCGGWLAVGWGSGLIRVQDVAI